MYKMRDYVRISLETHLFFARIMKEHSLFLQAGFAQKDTEWIQRADFFRRQFEDLLRRTVQMSNRMISGHVLRSEELVTGYTMDAERRTSNLTGLPIDMRITAAQKELECEQDSRVSRDDKQMVDGLNERAVWLLNGLIDFKERLLNNVKEGRMHTANYPLLIDHITREAKLYRETIDSMMKNQSVDCRYLQNQEEFWNSIMMEHALFIRGLLDPCEGKLINAADDFAGDFGKLLDMAQCQDNRASNMQGVDVASKETLAKTMQLRDFKAAGAEGILNQEIKSIILPLLADHVLREANHYIRILEYGYMWQKE